MESGGKQEVSQASLFLISFTFQPLFSSSSQMNHQMSGLAVGGGAVPTPTGGWAPPTPASSGQTLSTQLWK